MDSISIVEPEAEAAKDIDDRENARAHAQLVTKFIKKYTRQTNTLDRRNFTSLICTSQVRANQERANAPAAMQKYIKQWSPTGAYITRHGKLVDVVVSEGEKLRKTVAGSKHIIGKMMKWEITKGKSGCHDNVAGEAPFIYPEFGGSGVDIYESIVTEGVQRGVLAESDKGKVTLRNSITGKVAPIAPNLKQFMATLKADLDFELFVRQHILAAAGVQTCLYR